MSANDYYNTIKGMADDLIERARAEGWDYIIFLDALHEDVDGCSMVIYTSEAKEVCQISRNDNYSVENFGAESCFDRDGIKWEAIAFGCVCGDILDDLAGRDDFDITDPSADPDDEEEW